MRTGNLGRIGFICPFWLPLWGGAEQYHYRLAKALQLRGFDVRVLCGTASDDSKDNGSIAADRFLPSGSLDFAAWRSVFYRPTPENFRTLSQHFAFMDEAVRWCRDNKIRVALIGNPFQNPDHFHLRELYTRLKSNGVRVGIFHHDLSGPVVDNLIKLYLQPGGTWTLAANRIIASMRDLAAKSVHRTEWAAMAGSPLFFEPHFVICNSVWSARFIDPLNQCPKLVLHPLVDEDHWSPSAAVAGDLPACDVLMINPQSRKNPKLMANVILEGHEDLTYRVLKGGWGNAFETFRPMLDSLAAERAEKVELVDYVRDIREAYRSAQLLFFPSLEEGYGMAPVEAMSCGTPVVSSNYPAIVEAVGDGARLLCPYKDPPERWIAAIAEVLANRAAWTDRALSRRTELSMRQRTEIDNVDGFLRRHI